MVSARCALPAGLDSKNAPFKSIHEFLTAVHIYTDEAKAGKTRYVEANHYCAHVRKDLRQCLIYDSHEQDAKLIGVEYMVYETFDAEEQAPDGFTDNEWEAAELQVMQDIINLYGKTWHFWQVDVGHQYPIGRPVLMGSVTSAEQVDLDVACARRNEVFGVDHVLKAEARKALQEHGSGDHPRKIPASIAFTAP
ncbi:hypothetical protein LTS10_010845 [Elasticomyces elasticus]|nr:hypothetical protein LTS10_010845 [Elasticomyces elasticus]